MVNKPMKEETFSELDELIKRSENTLIYLEKNPDDLGLMLDSLLRDIHSVKGIAGMERLDNMTGLTHRMEDMLEDMCEKGTKGDEIDVLLKALDLVSKILTVSREGGDFTEQKAVDDLIGEMNMTLKGVEESPPEEGVGKAALPAEEPEKAAIDPELVNVFKEECEEQLVEMDVDLTALESNPDNVELLNKIFRVAHSIKGGSQSLGYKTIGKLAHSMEGVLDSLRKKKVSYSAELMDVIFEASDLLKKMINAVPDIIEIDISSIAKRLKGTLEEGVSDEGLGAAPVNDTTVVEAVVKDARVKDIQTKETPAIAPRKDVKSGEKGLQTLRVDIRKLTDTMNLMGELVISKIRLDQRFFDFRNILTEITHKSELAGKIQKEIISKSKRPYTAVEEIMGGMIESVSHIGQVMKLLQEGIMNLRMVPVGVVFNRFPRVIRDISRKINKPVSLRITGEETEIDKTIVEELSDPLMHLIRNAMDHGLEDVEKRLERGKSAEGVIKVSAYHEGNKIVIDVEDDGGGINPETLKKKAFEDGHITEEEGYMMSDEDALNLIFNAGFSTKGEASDLSGRGVGMDVVKTNIARLNGDIEITSNIGLGTKFSIKLPLTLAIIEVLLIEVGGEVFAIPLSNVRETLMVKSDEINMVGKKEVINLRDHVLSIIRLYDFLGLEWQRFKGQAVKDRESQKSNGNIPIIVVSSVDRQVGIVVDRWLKKQEIVIKSLGDLLPNVKLISGGTILGDGRVALILDIAEIVSGDVISRVWEIDEKDRKGLKPGIGELKRLGEGDMGEGGDTIQKKVLLADDTETTRKMIKALLEEAGYKVDGVSNGVEAFEKARENFYDLIATDIIMTPMDGYELIGKLRGLEKYQKSPVFIISSVVDETDLQRGINAGANEFIVKHDIRKNLIKTIRKYI